MPVYRDASVMTEPWSCSGASGSWIARDILACRAVGRPEAARCRRTGTGQRPVLILADEPTGNLDSRSGAQILDLPADTPSGGRTILIVTHDETVATRAGRVIICATAGSEGGSGLGGSRSALSIYKLLPLSCLSFFYPVNSSLMGHVASPHTLWHHS